MSDRAAPVWSRLLPCSTAEQGVREPALPSGPVLSRPIRRDTAEITAELATQNDAPRAAVPSWRLTSTFARHRRPPRLTRSGVEPARRTAHAPARARRRARNVPCRGFLSSNATRLFSGWCVTRISAARTPAALASVIASGRGASRMTCRRSGFERDTAIVEYGGDFERASELADDRAQHVEGEPDLAGLDLGDRALRLADQLGELRLGHAERLSLIHISEPTRRTPISYAVFCLKK